SKDKINESTLTLENNRQANNSINEHIKAHDVSDDDEIMFDAFSLLNNDYPKEQNDDDEQNNEGEQNDINGSNVIEKTKQMKLKDNPKPIMNSDEPIDKIFEKIQKEFENFSLLTNNNVNSYFEKKQNEEYNLQLGDIAIHFLCELGDMTIRDIFSYVNKNHVGEELIKNIKEKYQSANVDYKLTEKSLKELEINF
ncbi:24391_t:CDS:2, partial [Racocetra persica]